MTIKIPVRSSSEDFDIDEVTSFMCGVVNNNCGSISCSECAFDSYRNLLLSAKESGGVERVIAIALGV